jgi:hypothetical protein
MSCRHDPAPSARIPRLSGIELSCMIFRLPGGAGGHAFTMGGWFLRFIRPYAGVASQTGVVPNGQGGYLIAKQAATGFPGLGNLKAEAMGEGERR